MTLESKKFLPFLIWMVCVACSPLDQPKQLTNELYESVFSETQIFFNPANKQPVPLISKPLSTKIRGPKGVYGWLPCFCSIESCSCCVDIRIHSLNSEDSGCVTVSPSSLDNSSMNAEIVLNNKTMVQERLSFDDPSPLCSPFPRLPFIAGCVKFNRIRTDKGHLRGCAKLEVRVTGTDAILWDMQFSCFKIGTDGIIFSNPNKNKDKIKPVKEQIKEPALKPMKKPNDECH